MGMDPVTQYALMGGLGALQGGLSGGGSEEPFLLEPYGGAPGEFLDPRRMLTQNVKDVAHLGAVLGERAAAPASLPGAFVQPTQWYGGGGLPFPMGRTAMDPALFAPDMFQQRAGASFAQPHFGSKPGVGPLGSDRWLFGAAEDTAGLPLTGGYAPRGSNLRVDSTDKTTSVGDPNDPASWQALDQGPVSVPAGVGGGIPQLMANLELLGVPTDPSTGGLVNQGPDEIGNLALFTGSDNVRRRYPGGPPPGEIQTPTWAPDSGDLGPALTVPKPTQRRNPGTFGPTLAGRDMRTLANPSTKNGTDFTVERNGTKRKAIPRNGTNTTESGRD